MSLSVCVRNVRAISKGGSVTEGNMTCENIDSLKSVGYTIEYLDEPPITDSTASSFEPIQEIEQIVEEPIIEQIETVIIQEPEIQTLVIKQQDIFDRSLVLAEEITQVKANNIELTNENNNLKSQLVDVITQEELTRIKMENQIDKVHDGYSKYAEIKTYASTSGQQSQAGMKYDNHVESSEIGLENYAESLGFTYIRANRIDDSPYYYHNRGGRISNVDTWQGGLIDNPIPLSDQYQLPPIEETESYIPTSSAIVKDF